MRFLARAVALVVPIAVVAACSTQTDNGQACEPGDYLPITLTDGGAGFLKCLGDGSAYALYGGSNPNFVPDAGDAAAACSGANGAKLGFMCAGCTGDTDCAAGLVCFPFPNKGGELCTRTCSSNDVCPSPSEGCGNNGHCKP